MIPIKLLLGPAPPFLLHGDTFMSILIVSSTLPPNLEDIVVLFWCIMRLVDYIKSDPMPIWWLTSPGASAQKGPAELDDSLWLLIQMRCQTNNHRIVFE